MREDDDVSPAITFVHNTLPYLATGPYDGFILLQEDLVFILLPNANVGSLDVHV
jgi:hypothetical protein